MRGRNHEPGGPLGVITFDLALCGLMCLWRSRLDPGESRRHKGLEGELQFGRENWNCNSPQLSAVNCSFSNEAAARFGCPSWVGLHLAHPKNGSVIFAQKLKL